MKRFPMFLIVFLALFTVAGAQTGSFIEAGVGGSYGSNRPLDREKGGPDLFGSVGVKIAEFKDSSIQIRVRGKLSREPELLDLFARDNNPERKATGELRLQPEVRWNLSTESYFKPFVAGG